MGNFPKRLIVECIPKVDTKFRFAVYLRPFEYVTNDGEVILVPIGFKTDFASVPWAFRLAIPKTGRYNEAAVIHDYLCYLSNKGLYSRERADRIFREAMITLGVNERKIRKMYKSVSAYTKILKLKRKFKK